MKQLNKTNILILLASLCSYVASAQLGNHVFSGSESVAFGDLSLSTSTNWTSHRSATPGYWSAIGTAMYTNGSDANNINGYVKHYANAADQAYSFPVGDGTDLRTLSVSGTRTANSELAVAWIVGDPNSTNDPTGPNAGMHNRASVSAPIENVNSSGQWDWQDLNNGAVGTTVTVSIPDMSGYAPLASDLRLVGWNGSSWIDLSGSATASGTTENSTLSGTMQAGITSIGIGLITSPLPLDLINFEVYEQDCKAVLYWTTEYEENTSHFVIERKAAGGAFQTIGQVIAQGQQAHQTNYTYTDTKMESGIQYQYRLKMVDIDTRFTYSSIQVLNINCQKDLSVKLYPNPASDQIRIKASGLDVGRVNLSVYNALGQLIETVQQDVSNTQLDKALDISSWSVGPYILRLSDLSGQQLHTQRFIKEDN